MKIDYTYMLTFLLYIIISRLNIKAIIKKNLNKIIHLFILKILKKVNHTRM